MDVQVCTLIASTLKPPRVFVTGPVIIVGLMVTRSTPSSAANSQAARSACTCSQRISGLLLPHGLQQAPIG